MDPAAGLERFLRRCLGTCVEGMGDIAAQLPISVERRGCQTRIGDRHSWKQELVRASIPKDLTWRRGQSEPVEWSSLASGRLEPCPGRGRPFLRRRGLRGHVGSSPQPGIAGIDEPHFFIRLRIAFSTPRPTPRRLLHRGCGTGAIRRLSFCSSALPRARCNCSIIGI